MAGSLRWNLVCRVVDNYGDAGVAWRLARQLADEHRQSVTLWIDDVASLARLVPEIDADAPKPRAQGVDIRLGPSPGDAAVAEADVVVEAFGGGLPAPAVAAMAAAARPPVWIVLEYLSAEAWVDGAHGRASPHPATGSPRWVFFPGFTAATGGLLRERDLIARREAFRADPRRRAATLARLGVARADTARVALVFVYPGIPPASLFDAWADAASPTIALVPPGVAVEAVDAWTGGLVPATGRSVTRGALTIAAVPFVAQREFDEVLWACDFALVRGEDSFVRAQWAALPFAWQAYAQEANAHLAKVDAFLARYLVGADPALAGATRAFWQALNTADAKALATTWPAFEAALPGLEEHARGWASRLAAARDLAAQLVEFVEDRL